jgi:hypothetical protein
MPSIEAVAITLGAVVAFAAFIRYDGLWSPRWLNDGCTPANKRRLNIGTVEGDWFSLAPAWISVEPNEGYECRGRFKGRWFAIKPIVGSDGTRSLTVDGDEHEDLAFMNGDLEYHLGPITNYQRQQRRIERRNKWLADLQTHLRLRPPSPSSCNR